jgi:dihydroxyacetone kinase-like protein
MSGITKEDLARIIEDIYRKIDEKKDYLSRLDTEIGDGDHGFGISNGFRCVYQKLDEFMKEGTGDFLKRCGFEIIKVVGGASGAVFGTLFIGMASYYNKNLAGKQELSLDDMTHMLKEALDAIKKRGGAQAGDKTMIDAFEPALNELEKGVEENLTFSGAFERACKSALQGAENTKNMVGKRGRAKNVGERGIGYIDPGSMSMAIIFRTMADYFSEQRI